MTDTKEPEMLDLVRDCLRELGYEGNLLQDNYPFRDFMTQPSVSRSSVRHIPIATFAQWPPDYSYACFGVAYPDDDSPESITPYRSLGASQIFALHPTKGYVQRWKMNATGNPQLLDTFTFDEIPATFQHHRAQWGPQRILEARMLSSTEAEAQLDFFDAGLLPVLEASLRPKLERDIDKIMQRSKKVYKDWHIGASFDDVLTPAFRLIFRLIAAKMLIDRNHKPEWRELDAPAVIEAVDAFYFQHNTPEPVLADERVQDAAWQQVRKGLDLQNLSVATLAHLYENAFVTEEIRRKQSIHATPPEVAEYIVRQLPIEKLDVRERRIFEPFTGAAPFLISGLRRLRELLPKDMSPQERHDYFVAMLSGMENDPFAREIARYALILADYPNPDGWRIHEQNTFTSPDFGQLLREANIVLCNPPFGTFELAEREDIETEAAYTKEVEALRRVLAHHPIMFGFVLPRSFLDRRDFRSLRQDIAANYKSISITVLPDKTFKKASQEVALLTAHNIHFPDAPYSYAEVRSDQYDSFLRSGEPIWKDDYSILQSRNNDVDFHRTPLQSIWEALRDYSTLESLAEIHVGVRYKTGLLSECVSDEPLLDFVPGIQVIPNYMEAYTIGNHQYLCTKPEVMRDNAYKLPWDHPKVIVNRARLNRGYWNVAGAIDEQGLWASQQFYGMWPKGDTSIELLAALISGPVANAYLFLHRTGRDNQIRLIEHIPVPEFTEEQTDLIVSLVQEYYSYRGQWISEPRRAEHLAPKCLERLYQIDAAVLEAYNLPADLERELLRQFDGAERRPLPFTFPGYGEEYEHAKEKLQAEKAYLLVLGRYHELVDKEFVEGLTASESEEQAQLGREVDAHHAPFYRSIIDDLKAGKL